MKATIALAGNLTAGLTPARRDWLHFCAHRANTKATLKCGVQLLKNIGCAGASELYNAARFHGEGLENAQTKRRLRE